MEIEKDGSCTRSVRCDREKCINNKDKIKKSSSSKRATTDE